ncbi:MAG: hypothetical protein P9L94_00290 [Candidatus Hinthialibacter antarcticus]|nr:hypothetical protein [Candidatus Hinthialibacter antarcticus]
MNRRNENKRFTIGLHAFYMLFLAPIFLFVTIIMGLVNFSDTYRLIEDGFGDQIEAISLVTASFLDGDEIVDGLMRQFQPQGLVYIEERLRLLGIDKNTGWLLEIDPVHGGANVLNTSLSVNLIDLAFDANRRTYYGVDASGTIYSASDSTFNNLQKIASLERAVSGIAFNSINQQICICGDGYFQIDAVSKYVLTINENDYMDYVGLTYNSDNNSLYALRVDPVALCQINSVNGEVIEEMQLRLNEEPDEFEEPVNDLGELAERDVWNAFQYDRIMQLQDEEAKRVVQENILNLLLQTDAQMNEVEEEVAEEDDDAPALDEFFEGPVYGLAWKAQTQDLFVSSDALLEIDSDSGALVQSGIWGGYRNEMRESYLTNVSPMRRIKEKLNVTYLYTFMQNAEQDLGAITYNIDSNIDADHSWIATEDSLPAESVFDLYGRILLGEIYQSDIVEWDEWGLIKTGYAPIFGQGGVVRAVVGTDVNVSVIGTKSRVHLLQTIGLGLLSFLLALLVMYAVTTAMSKPIALLNETALTVAAGEYGKKADEVGAKEFHALSHAFNLLSHDMKEAQDKREFDNKILHYQTARAELIRKLVQIREMLVPSQMDGWQTHHWGLGVNESVLSAVLKDVQGAMAWAGIQKGNSLVVLKTQIDIPSIVRKLLRLYRGDWTKISFALNEYYQDCVQGFFFIHRKDKCLYSLCRSEFVCYRINQQPYQRINLSETGSFPVESGDALIIVSVAIADAVQSIIEREADLKAGEGRVPALFERIQSEIPDEKTPTAERSMMILLEWA